MVAIMGRKRTNLAVDARTGLQHNPAFTRMMQARGFRIEHMGGTQSGYVRREPDVGEVVVTYGDGWLPTLERDAVLVSFFGGPHNHPLLNQTFPSLRAFAKTLLRQR